MVSPSNSRIHSVALCSYQQLLLAVSTGVTKVVTLVVIALNSLRVVVVVEVSVVIAGIVVAVVGVIIVNV